LQRFGSYSAIQKKGHMKIVLAVAVLWFVVTLVSGLLDKRKRNLSFWLRPVHFVFSCIAIFFFTVVIIEIHKVLIRTEELYVFVPLMIVFILATMLMIGFVVYAFSLPFLKRARLGET